MAMFADDEPFLDKWYGTGRAARIDAMRKADEMRSRGIAAVALFKPEFGGWVVLVYPGGIRQRT